MLLIPVPANSNSIVRVTLSGISYEFLFKWNNRDEAWRVDMALEGQDPFHYGQKLVPLVDPFENYTFPDFNHGTLRVARWEEGEPLGRNNFGVDKAYRLVYLTNTENTGVA